MITFWLSPLIWFDRAESWQWSQRRERLINKIQPFDVIWQSVKFSLQHKVPLLMDF